MLAYSFSHALAHAGAPLNQPGHEWALNLLELQEKDHEFQLSYNWWNKNKASTLPKTGLGKALKGYEEAWKLLKKQETVENADAAMNALTRAEYYACVAIKKC